MFPFVKVPDLHREMVELQCLMQGGARSCRISLLFPVTEVCVAGNTYVPTWPYCLQTSQIKNSIFKDLVTKCESGNVQIAHISFSVQLPLLCLALYLPASPTKSPSERGTRCLQSSDVTFSKRHFKGYMWDSPQPSKH